MRDRFAKALADRRYHQRKVAARRGKGSYSRKVKHGKVES